MIKMEVEIFPWDSLTFEVKKERKKQYLSPNMNTMTVDYFGMIPNDILHIILSFIDSFKESFSLLLVSKRFYHLLRPEPRWKSLCLQSWKDYKQNLVQQRGGNYSKEGEYDLELAQRGSGKD